MVNIWLGFPANTNSDDLPLDIVSTNVLLQSTEILPAAFLPQASLMYGIRVWSIPVYHNVSLTTPLHAGTHTHTHQILRLFRRKHKRISKSLRSDTVALHKNQTHKSPSRK